MKAIGARHSPILSMRQMAAKPPSPGAARTGSRQAKPGASLIKQSMSIAGHRTSLALEPAFWRRLNAVAAARGLSPPRLVAVIDAGRAPGASLSSAIRLFLLEEALTAMASAHS